MLAGCIEFALDPKEPSEPPPEQVAVTESFVQAPLPGVDLLLVIDDTASMAQEQAALASQFSALLGELDALGIGWQLGVVSTDMSGPEAGWLRGSPYVLDPGAPDRELAFAEMVQVGTDGAGPEAGLAAATEALALAHGGPNSGFRRPDALLHVVFVSDADDQSQTWLGADPVSVFLDTLASEATATGRPARASALVGPLPSGCSSATGTAQPALDYVSVANDSGGWVGSICAPDLGPVLAALSEASIEWPTTFPLEHVPVPESVRATVDGELTPVRVDPSIPAVVFDVPPPPDARVSVRYLVVLNGSGR